MNGFLDHLNNTIVLVLVFSSLLNSLIETLQLIVVGLDIAVRVDLLVGERLQQEALVKVLAAVGLHSHLKVLNVFVGEFPLWRFEVQLLRELEVGLRSHLATLVRHVHTGNQTYPCFRVRNLLNQANVPVVGALILNLDPLVLLKLSVFCAIGLIYNRHFFSGNQSELVKDEGETFTGRTDRDLPKSLHINVTFCCI